MFNPTGNCRGLNGRFKMNKPANFYDDDDDDADDDEQDYEN